MPSPVFEFERFELDIGSYQLRRAGRKVRLQRVPMDLLILLIERKGALVTREEIVSRVWNGDGLVDTQSSINTAIRKIRQALNDDGDNPHLVETVVGKGYRFIAEVSSKAAPEPTPLVPPENAPPIEPAASQPLPKPSRVRWTRVLVACSAVMLAALIAFSLFLSNKPQAEAMTVVPFTAVPGIQSWPAISPNGKRVAFGWTGETGNCSHIYVKSVGDASPSQITNSDECEVSPSWSRDGRWIAFLRRQAGGNLILSVVAATGGTARAIATLHGPSDYRPAWTPDGGALVVMESDPIEAPPGLVRVALNSGGKLRITTAQSGSTGDWCPGYSPDGRLLAYLHNTGSRRLSPLYVVPVDARGTPSAPPKKIETGSLGFIDFDWNADGRSLIAAAPSGLVRVPLSGGAIEPLPFAGGSQPTVAAHGNRLVYVQPYRDSDIFRLPGPGSQGRITRLISSTRQEFAPQYSSDARQIVFVSDRTGSEEIWVADSEGRNSRPVTSFAGPAVGSPRWSPDGNWIAFDSTAGGRAGIYLVSLVSATGEPARRITPAGVSCVRPSWSRDGRWIYFGSNQSGDWQVWKTTPRGDAPSQLTRNGGREAFEDFEGKFVYYTKWPPAVGIWRVPVSGGNEERITDLGSQGRWALSRRGLYFLSGSGELLFAELPNPRSTKIPTPGLQLGRANIIGVAPDDRWILLTALVRSEDDLMLVRNFH